MTCAVNGAAFHYECTREVLLSGGAINSPQLLMLSGIGPADQLQRHGIKVVHDAPNVGENLQDHLDICTLQHSTQPITYDRASDAKIAFEYFLRGHSGPGSSNIAEAGGFLRSPLAPDDRPDIQLHFVPAMLDDHGRHRLRGDGYTMHACFLRPRSRGRISIVSPRAHDKPRIEANYLSDPEGFDLRMMIECAKAARAIFRQPAFDAFRGAPIFPARDDLDDKGLEAFVRAKAETVYHPVGTCRMGSDAASVVDPQLRVRGVEGLRVVDASVMPTLIGGNTNAPTMMIAERVAELMTRRRRCVPASAATGNAGTHRSCATAPLRRRSPCCRGRSSRRGLRRRPASPAGRAHRARPTPHRAPARLPCATGKATRRSAGHAGCPEIGGTRIGFALRDRSARPRTASSRLRCARH